MDVAAPIRSGRLVKDLPVPVCGLVRADLAGDYRDVERDTDRLHRRVDEIAVGIRQDPRPPPAITGRRQSLPHVAEHRPRRQRAGERARLTFRQSQPRVDGQALERDREDLSIRRSWVGGLDRRLDVVKASNELIGSRGAEQLLELRADAAVPVDQRAVAVEGCPALHAAKPNLRGVIEIRAMEASGWPEVERIFDEGIATRAATFETEPPDYDSFDASHHADHRLVAIENGRVAGWVALAPTSTRACYAGVAESSVYVTESARGRGVGRALIEVLIASAAAGGIWTIQAGMFPENA